MIYLDACIVIYLLEGHTTWGPVIRGMMARTTDDFAVSPLVKAECLVQPVRSGNPDLVARFHRYFATVVPLAMPERVFIAAGGLRARFGLKMPDALHLACALHHRCTALWTNDTRLSAAGGDLVRVLAPE